jgi:hypothetical protein
MRYTSGKTFFFPTPCASYIVLSHLPADIAINIMPILWNKHISQSSRAIMKNKSAKLYHDTKVMLTQIENGEAPDIDKASINQIVTFLKFEISFLQKIHDEDNISNAVALKFLSDSGDYVSKLYLDFINPYFINAYARIGKDISEHIPDGSTILIITQLDVSVQSVQTFQNYMESGLKGHNYKFKEITTTDINQTPTQLFSYVPGDTLESNLLQSVVLDKNFSTLKAVGVSGDINNSSKTK